MGDNYRVQIVTVEHQMREAMQEFVGKDTEPAVLREIVSDAFSRLPIDVEPICMSLGRLRKIGFVTFDDEGLLDSDEVELTFANAEFRDDMLDIFYTVKVIRKETMVRISIPAASTEAIDEAR